MTSTSPAPALPPDMAAALAQLRDIRLPEAVSWWPLAPGWWVLIGIAVVAALGALVFEVRRRRSLKHRALREFEQIKTAKAEQLSTMQLAAEICVLIRRIVLSKFDGSRFANTHGEAWSKYLASTPNGMPEPIAHFIANAPYVNAVAAPSDGHADPQTGTPDKQALIVATETWIRRHA